MKNFHIATYGSLKRNIIKTQEKTSHGKINYAIKFHLVFRKQVIHKIHKMNSLNLVTINQLLIAKICQSYNNTDRQWERT